MSNVTFNWSNLPAGYCWTGAQQYMDDIFNLLVGELPGGAEIIVQNSLPGPDDQDKVWVRTNVDGTFEGIYIYQGYWHRPNPVAPSSSQIMIWKGTEADLWLHDGGDGTDPGTTAPTDFTGAMWQRDTDFNFAFPIGIGTNGSTYNGDPATVIGVGDTGGVEKVALVEAELPTHAHNMFTNEAVDATDTPSSAEPCAKRADSTPGGGEYEYDIQKGTTDPDRGITSEVGDGDYHQNMPPFIGVIFAKRTARKFYTALV